MQVIVSTLRRTTLMALIVSGVVATDNLVAEAAHDEPVTEAISHDLSELIQTPMPGADEQQQERYAAFTEALASELFTEAEVAAKQMIDLVRANESADSTDAAYARALQNLAIAQQAGGNYDAAEQNYTAALDTISVAADNLSLDLIPPLRGLATLYVDTGQSQAAFAVFERAVHISNVNFGPHSLNQVPIIDSKMKIYLEHDDHRSALNMLEQMFGLYSRHYPPGSEEMLPAYYQQADLYRELGMYREERFALEHILSTKQSLYSENDPALIEPNIKMAEFSMRLVLKDKYRRSVTTSSADRYLKTALSIAENSAEDEWEIRKDCLLSLANYYTVFDIKGRARRYYRDAWDLMSASEASLASRAEELEAPFPLIRPEAKLIADFEYNQNRESVAADEYLEGEMVIGFTVNDRGRTEDLRLVTASPENFSEMELRLRNAVKEFIYRPRIVDGNAAATPDLEHRFTYRYTPVEYRAAVEKASQPRSPWQAKKP